jgi:hypothetical protein
MKKCPSIVTIACAAAMTLSTGVAYADTPHVHNPTACNTGASAIIAYIKYMMSIGPGKVVTNPPPLGCN